MFQYSQPFSPKSETKLNTPPSYLNKIPNSELKNKLETQINTSILSLAGMQIGDEGAFHVARFLREVNHYTSIEIQRNNISASGFGAICEALKHSNKIRSILADSNNIGSDTSGLITLQELVRTSYSIEEIDLRNNRLKYPSAGAIANIIRDSNTLRTIDIRQNEIGNEGAKTILSTLRYSNKKVKVLLEENNVSPEVLNELNSLETEKFASQRNSQLLDKASKSQSTFSTYDTSGKKIDNIPYSPSHFNGNPISYLEYKPGLTPELYTPQRQEKYNQQSVLSSYQQPIQINQANYPLRSPPTFTPYSDRRAPINVESDIKDLHAKYEYALVERRERSDAQAQTIAKLEKVIHELQVAIDQERLKTERAEEKLESVMREMEVEKKYKHELEAKQSQLLDELHKKEYDLNDQNFELERLRKENTQLKTEVSTLKAEADQLVFQYNLRIKESEEKFNNALKEAISENNLAKAALERSKEYYENQQAELKAEYELKFRQFEEQLKSFSHVNNELVDELKKQTEYVQRLKIEQEDQIRKIVQRTREDEAQKAQVSMKNLENKLAALQETNEQLTRKNTDLIRDLQNFERRNKENQYTFESETGRLKVEIDRLHDQLNAANSTIEKLTTEVFAKENHATRLEKEYANIERELQKFRAFHSEEIEKLKRDFDFQRRRYDDNERQLNMKIAELERNLKESQIESNQVRTEYEKLQEMLQGNINKVISQTFVTHGKTGAKYDLI